MHHLSALYGAGLGVQRCEETAMVWRSKAAQQGHLIAKAQLDALQNE